MIYVVLGFNIVAFCIWGLDKYFAKTNRRRISEKQLFFWAIIGGSIGAICAMYAFRHKTRHWYFRIGLPLILIVQILLVYLLKVKL